MKARSPVLYLAVRYLMPLMLIFSFFLFMRGHNEVGGGFVGGLVAASAFMLYSIARSPGAARSLLPFSPLTSIVAGLAIAFTSGLIGLFSGLPFMTGLWLPKPLPVLGKIGTPFLFDLGVYLLVVGICLHILLTLAEDE
jgi:multicomponent Na+:H+ antiporter subunit B